MSNLIVNSAAGDDYFDIAGSATTSSTQPELKGAASQLGSNNGLLNNANIVSDVMATGDGSSISAGQNINMVDTEEVFTNTRKVNTATELRTTKYSEAIRNDKWNAYSATWDSGYPETGNDATAIGLANDDAYTVRTFVFGDGVIPDEKVI